MFSKIIMFAAGAGAIFGWVKMKQGNDFGKGIVIVCALTAIVLAGYNAKNRAPDERSSEEARKVIAQRKKVEALYQRTSGEKLGQELADKYPAAKAVVIRPLQIKDIDPTADYPATHVIQRVEGLKAGFGEMIDIVEVMHPPVTDAMRKNYEAAKESYVKQTGKKKFAPDFYDSFRTRHLPNALREPATFNRLTQSIPSRADLVIIVSGFPEEAAKLDLWEKRFTVAGIVTGASPQIFQAIKKGLISALVVDDPAYAFKPTELPEDLNERFNQRFLYVTAENVQEVETTFKRLFPR